MHDSSKGPSAELHRGAADFHTTRWSLVRRASGRDEQASRALEELCVMYWQPIYVYMRRAGKSADDAADLTQGFIATLLEKSTIAKADQERGRFRAYLLGAVKHYALNEVNRERTQKRGTGAIHLSLDYQTAEGRYAREAADSENPETLFIRRWALGVLENAMEQLKVRYHTEGKGLLFDELSPSLLDESHSLTYAAIAQKLAMETNSVKVAAYRLRTRYRDLIRAAVADTVQDAAEIDDEIKFLIAALEK